MARRPRISAIAQPHHIVQRGNNRQPIFFAKDDYEYFLSLLWEFAGVFSCDVHAYVLMTNHVHLLVTPQSKNGISKLMQFIGRRYVRYVNKMYRRTGSLWEGRFKASIIDSDRYLLTCMRYIELNPVRARMVKKPDQYAWSSYHRNANGERAGAITPHMLYDTLASSPEARRASYIALFNNNTDAEEFEDIRAGLKGGWVVGSDAFKDKIKKALKDRVAPLPRGGERIRGKERLKRRRVS